MKVAVDLNLCDGYLNCVEASPEIFDVNDETGQAVVLIEEPDESLHEAARHAARVCPARAIILTETQS